MQRFGSATLAIGLSIGCAAQGTKASPETPLAAPSPAVATAARDAPTPSSDPPASRHEASARTEADCKACNGDWGIHGIAQTPSCNCRTHDGGKRCRDGTECEGLCTAADEPEREIVEPGPPARGFFVGRCSKFSSVFGCYRPIEDGAGKKVVDLAEPPQMICAD
ncbi:MAG TPA: hypothetical protein VF103_05515 [Polyangiaceae bacterium]